MRVRRKVCKYCFFLKRGLIMMEVVGLSERCIIPLPYYNVPYTRRQKLQYLKLGIFTCHSYIIQQNVFQLSIHQELHVICFISFLAVLRQFDSQVRVKRTVAIEFKKIYLKFNKTLCCGNLNSGVFSTFRPKHSPF